MQLNAVLRLGGSTNGAASARLLGVFHGHGPSVSPWPRWPAKSSGPTVIVLPLDGSPPGIWQITTSGGVVGGGGWVGGRASVGGTTVAVGSGGGGSGE